MYPSTTELADLYDLMPQGVAYCTMQFDGNKAVDLTYNFVNSAFYKLTGLSDVIGKKLTEVIPNIFEMHPTLIPTYGEVIKTGNSMTFEINIISLGIWLTVYAARCQSGKLLAIFDNISARKASEAQLEKELESLTTLSNVVKDFRAKMAVL